MLTGALARAGYACRAIHGDKDQHERTVTIAAFKRNEFPILVATDVAARGLDIKNLHTVVNYDVARYEGARVCT